MDEKINVGKILRYGLYLLVLLIAQNILFTQLRLLGVCPMVLPAAAVAMGMFEGATWGPLFSLLLGYFADMAFIENSVFSANSTVLDNALGKSFSGNNSLIS